MLIRARPEGGEKLDTAALGFDPRVLVPVIMLGGLATSLAFGREADKASHARLATATRRPEAIPVTTAPTVEPPSSIAEDSPSSAVALEPPEGWLHLWRPGAALGSGGWGPRAPAFAADRWSVGNPPSAGRLSLSFDLLRPPRVGSPLEATAGGAGGPRDGSGSAPSRAANDREPCREGMVPVEGEHCPTLGHVCLRTIEGLVERCAEFAPVARCAGAARKMSFCIDQFEYPNLAGVRPAVMVSWYEAKAACEGEGKRLCTESEWTLACEGTERLPYPYGYERDSTACNIDREQLDVNAGALTNPRAVSQEVARLDQRVPSGEFARCRSPFGVNDLTGNVDEWVVAEKSPGAGLGSDRPYLSVLKGGYWGPVRNRCRAATTAHSEGFRYYQIGFRCCANHP